MKRQVYSGKNDGLYKFETFKNFFEELNAEQVWFDEREDATRCQVWYFNKVAIKYVYNGGSNLINAEVSLYGNAKDVKTVERLIDEEAARYNGSGVKEEDKQEKSLEEITSYMFED